MTDPADEPGWCLTTLHDFAPDTIFARGLALSSDESHIYVGTNNHDIFQIDLSNWASPTAWRTLGGGSILAFVGDDNDNLYATGPTSQGITRIALGIVTDDWAVLPGAFAIGLGLTWGADGNLYAIGHDGDTKAVFKITPAGVVTEVAGLRETSAAVDYDYVAVLSDATAWVSLDPPPAAYAGIDTVLRRYVTPESFVQSVSTRYRSGGGVVPLAGLAALDAVEDGDCLVFVSNGDNTGARNPPETSGWTLISDQPGALGGRESHAVYYKFATSTPEPNPYPEDVYGILVAYRGVATVGTVQDAATRDDTAPFDKAPDVTAASPNAVVGRIYAWNDLGGGSSATACAGYRVVGFAGIPGASGNGLITFADNSSADGPVGPTSPGAQGEPVWSPFCTPGVSGTFSTTSFVLGPLDPTVLPAVVGTGRPASSDDVPIQTLASAGDGSTEAFGGLFVDDQDHLLVPMTTYGGNGTTTASLGWFLRVAPDGSATRVASTWSYTGSPGPADTATNIADGALGVSLADELDQGAGMSVDRKSLFFVGAGDENGTAFGNLLRRLRRCAAGGWVVGSIRIG